MSTSSADAYTPEFSALVVDDELHHDTASGRAIRDVVNAIRAHGGSVYAHNAGDGGLVVEISLPTQSSNGATS